MENVQTHANQFVWVFKIKITKNLFYSFKNLKSDQIKKTFKIIEFLTQDF